MPKRSDNWKNWKNWWMLEATPKIKWMFFTWTTWSFGFGGGGSKQQSSLLLFLLNVSWMLGRKVAPGCWMSTILDCGHSFLVLDCWDVGCSRLPPFFPPHNFKKLTTYIWVPSFITEKGIDFVRISLKIKELSKLGTNAYEASDRNHSTFEEKWMFKNILKRARKDVEASQMNNPHQQLKRQKIGLWVVKSEKG